MSDRRKKLEALANKRKNEDLEKELGIPKKTSKSSSVSSRKANAALEKQARLQELEYERQERELIKKGKNLDTYDDDDGFVVNSDEEEEEVISSEEEEEEEFTESDSESGSDRKRKRKSSKKGKGSSSKGKKAKKAKKSHHTSDSDSDSEDDSLDNELDYLDTKNIITGGRRTRGKRVDYSQFGPDGSDED
ncbi:hypothetical protein BCR32DRAFT_271018 [Anaeromyces robustus]|uniref:Histone chaperone domain-containing protein n=1 Tax=Anaeromyces robustus TaxID=1754192 RepID=A0A1Y1WTK0_9FUNG|nr:hypothetical protein BCR32DRAFT_271018 [Anaeromyces robustus]|eukprot:ORX76857.1 hypothetical protein BCR32DRAFT_271018 [Anaeromyces robustus]